MSRYGSDPALQERDHRNSCANSKHEFSKSHDELNGLLLRAESLFDSGDLKPGVDAPVAFVLHGAEAKLLLSKNYQANKPLVDLAARLSAFKVVNIKVCRTWMGGEGIKQSQLPPFISTVRFGTEEEQRLMKQENYVYF